MGLRRGLGRLWLRAFGWEAQGSRPPFERAVIVGYPHTSSWDLPFALSIAWSLDLDIRWVGKASLFRPPFGSLMRLLGGIPIDREGGARMVDAVVDAIEELDHVYLVVAPEGTRSRAGHWRSGFYWIAAGAKVPIVLGFLDYGRKRGGFGEVLEPTGDLEADMERIHAFYEGMVGKRPERQGPVALAR